MAHTVKDTVRHTLREGDRGTGKTVVLPLWQHRQGKRLSLTDSPD